VRLDGLLDAEGGAVVKTAIEALMSVPARDDERTAGQRRAPAARLEGVGPIPLETAQRHGCDATVSWLLGQAELENETSHAKRQIPPSTRRALVARDRDCVFYGCHRPAAWCDGHHVR
jgi:hypothetical protein